MLITLKGAGIIDIRQEEMALNAISPYYTMFPLSFPMNLLRGASRYDRVLDPFCGRGTTNFAARLLGLESFGFDNNNVAVAITKAKLVKVSPVEVVDECKEILQEGRNANVKMPTGDFWELAYFPDTLTDICILREELIERCNTDVRVALRAIIMGGLHGPLGKHTYSYLSNQMPRTYATKPGSAVRYWKQHKMFPKKVDLLEVVKKRANRYYAHTPQKVNSNAIVHDSRKDYSEYNIGRFDWIITSPPYFGMTTYSTDQWLRDWFLGGTDYPSYVGKNKIASGGLNKFRDDLFLVWRNVAGLSNDKARLIVKFGALPSMPYDHVKTITDSIEKNDSGWKIVRIRDGGLSEDGLRQSSQFLSETKNSIREIDVYAIKE